MGRLLSLRILCAKSSPLYRLVLLLTSAGIPLWIVGCGGGSKTATQNSSNGLAIPHSGHVVLVMEENQSYDTVVGDTSVWPNYNKLVAEGALPTNYYADAHGSISDYFMLTTGQILTDNDSSTQVFNVDNIARRMLQNNVPFRVYAEGYREAISAATPVST